MMALSEEFREHHLEEWSADSRGIHKRICFRGCRWQGEVERRASPIIAFSPNPPTVRYHDRLTAHAAALRLGRKERVEYLVAVPIAP
jgi:hypothetical protein